MSEYLMIYFSESSNKTIGLMLDGTLQALEGTPVEVFSNWCNEAGTSLQGRLECFRKKTGIVQKPPIYVGGIPPVIFIPTTSMKKKECIYLRADQIEHIRSEGVMSVVTFKQKISWRIPVCARSLRNRTRLSMDYVRSLRYPG